MLNIDFCFLNNSKLGFLQKTSAEFCTSLFLKCVKTLKFLAIAWNWFALMRQKGGKHTFRSENICVLYKEVIKYCSVPRYWTSVLDVMFLIE